MGDSWAAIATQSSLLAQSVPQSWLDIALLPGLAIFFGGLIYGLGIRTELLGGSAPWKWAALLVLAFGAWVGLGPFLLFVGGGFESEAYRGMMEIRGRKMLVAHWAGFLGPVVCILGMIGYEFRRRIRAIQE